MFRFLAVALFLSLPAQAETFRGAVVMVDGDTLRVGGSENLRLIGIDAVESDQTCDTEQGLPFDCGAFVTAQVRTWFNGRLAVCEANGRGGYGRPLVTCRIEGVDLGDWLVREGWARTYREDPTYAEAEKEAVLMARGLWAMNGQDPAVHREIRVVGRHAPDPGCAIKGNISANGRIYHMPGQVHYVRTGIREDNGERWFCSAAEAEAAGWRAARR